MFKPSQALIKQVSKRAGYRAVRFLQARLAGNWDHILFLLYKPQAHERDIYLFKYLQGVDGLVLDLGANSGQFALSLLNVNTSLRVESWEPNRRLRWILAVLKCLRWRRFKYRLIGAGSAAETKLLHVPTTRGNDLSTNASLDQQEFDKGYVQQRLAEYSKDGNYQFQTLEVDIVCLLYTSPSPRDRTRSRMPSSA